MSTEITKNNKIYEISSVVLDQKDDGDINYVASSVARLNSIGSFKKSDTETGGVKYINKNSDGTYNGAVARRVAGLVLAEKVGTIAATKGGAIVGSTAANIGATVSQIPAGIAWARATNGSLITSATDIASWSTSKGATAAAAGAKTGAAVGSKTAGFIVSKANAVLWVTTAFQAGTTVGTIIRPDNYDTKFFIIYGGLTYYQDFATYTDANLSAITARLSSDSNIAAASPVFVSGYNADQDYLYFIPKLAQPYVINNTNDFAVTLKIKPSASYKIKTDGFTQNQVASSGRIDEEELNFIEYISIEQTQKIIDNIDPSIYKDLSENELENLINVNLNDIFYVLRNFPQWKVLIILKDDAQYLEDANSKIKDSLSNPDSFATQQDYDDAKSQVPVLQKQRIISKYFVSQLDSKYKFVMGADTASESRRLNNSTFGKFANDYYNIFKQRYNQSATSEAKEKTNKDRKKKSIEDKQREEISHAQLDLSPSDEELRRTAERLRANNQIEMIKSSGTNTFTHQDMNGMLSILDAMRDERDSVTIKTDELVVRQPQENDNTQQDDIQSRCDSILNKFSISQLQAMKQSLAIDSKISKDKASNLMVQIKKAQKTPQFQMGVLFGKATEVFQKQVLSDSVQQAYDFIKASGVQNVTQSGLQIISSGSTVIVSGAQQAITTSQSSINQIISGTVIPGTNATVQDFSNAGKNALTYIKNLNPGDFANPAVKNIYSSVMSPAFKQTQEALTKLNESRQGLSQQIKGFLEQEPSQNINMCPTMNQISNAVNNPTDVATQTTREKERIQKEIKNVNEKASNFQQITKRIEANDKAISMIDQVIQKKQTGN